VADLALPAAAAPRRRLSAGHVVLGLALLLVVFGPWVLPEFAQNTLVRSCLYAVVAITVDLLWGYTGILTFGQATFFGIGAYAAGLVFTHVGFSPGRCMRR
jgi:branched-chain amino acid transport system permease protein